jgi:hypothetical protein
MKVYVFTFQILFIFIFGTFVVKSQTTCESDSSYLDTIISKAKEGDLVIAIARLGKKERTTELNRKRLYNVKAYLTKYIKSSILSKHPKNIVLASGEKTNGLGSIEIYFQGELFATFYLSHNEILYVGECAVDFQLYKTACDIKTQKIFYPCLNKKRK